MYTDLTDILPDFEDLHVVVIGDVMIDRYIRGDVRRISPEAPVPVVDWWKTENRPGGAANVALNLSELGAQVSLVSVVGDDEDAIILEDMMNRHRGVSCHLKRDKNRRTTVKSRIVARHQQLLRIDSEDNFDIHHDQVEELMSELTSVHLKTPVHGVILQDYNKGVLTDTSISLVLSWANENGIFSFVDPKEKNFFSYQNCTVFKPNKKEVTQALSSDWKGNYHQMAQHLREKIHHEVTLITLSEDGLYIGNQEQSFLVPTSVRNISDVSGAGDTVISIISLCFLKKVPLDIMGWIANVAGGQVCESPGVVPINLVELKEELQKNQNKIK